MKPSWHQNLLSIKPFFLGMKIPGLIEATSDPDMVIASASTFLGMKIPGLIEAR